MYHPRFMQLLSILALILIISGSAFAWDFSYEGDVLPTDPSLGSNIWTLQNEEDASMASVQDGALRILDDSQTRNLGYTKRVAGWDAWLTPVTAEARVKVVSGSCPVDWNGPVKFSLCPMGAYVNVLLYPDHMLIVKYGLYQTVQADFTQYRTVRLARDSYGHVNVWLDGSEIYSGTTSGYQQGDALVWFGGPGLPEVTSDAYWDYVRVSTEYLPVPEPSSLLVMAGGLVSACGSIIIRRRRQA